MLIPQLEIVAMGARTPVGLTAESSAAAVRAGISRYGAYPFTTARGEPVVVAADGLLNHALEGRDRLVHMAESVLKEVETKLGQEVLQTSRLQILLALPETRPGFSEEDATWVTQALVARTRAQNPRARVDVGGRGHAAAIRAVEQAAWESGKGSYSLFLVIAVDSYHHAATFAWLERSRRFTQPGVRNGFTPGEGAGCLALASEALRRRLRLPRLATLRGIGTAQESHLRDSDTGSLGIGMTLAVQDAVAGMDRSREGIDFLYTDINGERYRSEEWGFVALRTTSVPKSPGYKAPSDCWGDVGAASGALGAILAVQAFARGYAPGPRALVTAGSDGGLRGAMLLQKPGLS